MNMHILLLYIIILLCLNYCVAFNTVNFDIIFVIYFDKIIVFFFHPKTKLVSQESHNSEFTSHSSDLFLRIVTLFLMIAS